LGDNDANNNKSAAPYVFMVLELAGGKFYLRGTMLLLSAEQVGELRKLVLGP
jgi:hypothetical protein